MALTQRLAATGYSDTTRVGGGNPNLGLDLAKNNQTNILKAIKEFKKNINEIESLIKNNTVSYTHLTLPTIYSV